MVYMLYACVDELCLVAHMGWQWRTWVGNGAHVLSCAVRRGAWAEMCWDGCGDVLAGCATGQEV